MFLDDVSKDASVCSIDAAMLCRLCTGCNLEDFEVIFIQHLLFCEISYENYNSITLTSFESEPRIGFSRESLVVAYEVTVLRGCSSSPGITNVICIAIPLFLTVYFYKL